MKFEIWYRWGDNEKDLESFVTNKNGFKSIEEAVELYKKIRGAFAIHSDKFGKVWNYGREYFKKVNIGDKVTLFGCKCEVISLSEEGKVKQVRYNGKTYDVHQIGEAIKVKGTNNYERF